MRELRDARWIQVKGGLFLLLGLLAGGCLLAERYTWKDVFLLGVAVWSFCRFYYFAFYVMERYVDGDFRFRGLLALGWYLIKAGNKRANLKLFTD